MLILILILIRILIRILILILTLTLTLILILRSDDILWQSAERDQTPQLTAPDRKVDLSILVLNISIGFTISISILVLHGSRGQWIKALASRNLEV